MALAYSLTVTSKYLNSRFGNTDGNKKLLVKFLLTYIYVLLKLFKVIEKNRKNIKNISSTYNTLNIIPKKEYQETRSHIIQKPSDALTRRHFPKFPKATSHPHSTYLHAIVPLPSPANRRNSNSL